MNLRLAIRGGQYHALLFITTKSCETQTSQHELITSLPLFSRARHLVPLSACLFTYLHACFLPAFSPSPQCMFLYLRAWLAIRCSLARSLFLPLPGGFIIHADNSFHNRTKNTKGTGNLKPFPRSLVHNAGLAWGEGGGPGEPAATLFTWDTSSVWSVFQYHVPVRFTLASLSPF